MWLLTQKQMFAHQILTDSYKLVIATCGFDMLSDYLMHGIAMQKDELSEQSSAEE